MLTGVLAVLTLLFFGACVVEFFDPRAVPFEVLLWGGLILIFAWWGHDALHNRKVAA